MRTGIKQYGKKLIVFLVVLLMSGATSVLAADSKCTVNIEGTCYYNKAYDMLAYINDEREKQGVGALSFDTELAELAMQRAAECSLYFSHTRPNGTDCFSISGKVAGENILYGAGSAQDAFEMWMNSQGHRENMMDAGYKSIGIACFKQGETSYWVQLFGTAQRSSVNGKADKKAVYSVEIAENLSKIELRSDLDEMYYRPGNSFYINARVTNKEASRISKILANSFTWSSSNSSIASVTSAGKVTVKKAGTVTITAKPKNGTAAGYSMVLNCLKANPRAFSAKLKYASVEYKGTDIWPQVIVKSGKKTLKYDRDYTLSWTNGDRVGISEVEVEGLGKYEGHYKKLTLKVIPRKMSISSLKRSGKNAIVVKWKKHNAADGYQIQVSTKKSFSSNVKKYEVKNASTTQLICQNLKRKKNYYVRIRAYTKADDQIFYSKWSKVKKIKTK